jgi:hypothetical protein
VQRGGPSCLKTAKSPKDKGRSDKTAAYRIRIEIEALDARGHEEGMERHDCCITTTHYTAHTRLIETPEFGKGAREGLVALGPNRDLPCINVYVRPAKRLRLCYIRP